jgi:two-component sensor histidine kinase
MSRALLAEHEVRLIAEMDEVWLDAGRCWRIGLIVAELIRNSVRHGLAGRGGCVRVSLMQGVGRVRCLVSDNGRAPTNPRQGRGRRLIEMLADEMGGEVGWRFTPLGCVAELTFPDID